MNQLREQFENETGITAEWPSYIGEPRGFGIKYVEWLESRLSHPVTEMVTDEEIEQKVQTCNDSFYSIGFVTGAKWMRYRLTQPQSQWISVKDRLPNKDDNYLVNVVYPNQTVLVRMMLFTVEMGCFHDFIEKYVTHWMPLPQSPKQSEP